MIRSTRRQKHASLILSATACLVFLFLAVRAWLALDDPIQLQVSPGAVRQTDKPIEPMGGAAALDPAQLALVLDRPVFSPTRRPPQPVALALPAQTAPAAIPPAPPPPILDFALVGIVEGVDARVALVLPQGGQPTQKLRQGDEFHGWVLTLIGEDRATFRSAGQAKELVLDFTHAPPAP